MLLAGQLVYGSYGGFTINSLLSTEYLYFYSLKHGDPVKREEIKNKPEVVILGGNMFYIDY